MAEKKTKTKPVRRSVGKKTKEKKVKVSDKLAVLKLGGSQHLVREGTELEVHRLDLKEAGKAKVEALLLRPKIAKGHVEYKLLEHTRGPKIDVTTYKAKSRYRRKMGFRASLSKVVVEKIIAK